MKRQQVTWLLALVAVASCALPELRVDPDLDENEAGSTGDDDSPIGGAAGGDMAGGVGGGKGGDGQGGGATGGTAVGLGGSATGGKGGSAMGLGGSATGGKGGAVTGGKGGTSTGGKGGTATGGAGGVCADLTNCSGSCVDTDTDDEHCGACNAFCEPGELCAMGECVCRRLVGASNYLLIDDLEDDNGIVGDDQDPQLRVGYWYAYNDLSAGCMQVPEAGPSNTFLPNCGNANCSMQLPTPNGSNGAAHMAGSGCSVWGAGMGFSFASCNERSTAYDASAYNGIRLWYRSSTPFRLHVGTMDAIPTSSGGTCADVVTECHNTHGVILPAAPAGSMVDVPFSTLTQDFGTMRTFDKTQLSGLQFSVAQNLSFDLWVDDIAFIL